LNVALIYNPTAGSAGISAERKAVTAAKEMAKLGARVTFMPTSGPGSATDLAREAVASGVRRVVVAGGDGTINEAINGFSQGETELAVIPAGTANVLAMELGIPFRVKEAAHIAVTAAAKAIDLGVAGNRYFTLMAGVGFDALAVKNLNPVLKKTLRQAAFPISGIKTFVREDLPLLRVETLDGNLTEGYFVVISNSRYYGGHFGPNPDASADDGLLDVCVLKHKNFTAMASFWLRSLASSRLDQDEAAYFRAGEVTVTCPEEKTVLVQTDGDVIGELPMRFHVIPGGLKVCKGYL
jgi:YegS/Rv2252/BmrU family lipid kinase